MKQLAVFLLLALPAQAHADAIGAAIVSAVVAHMEAEHSSDDDGGGDDD